MMKTIDTYINEKFRLRDDTQLKHAEFRHRPKKVGQLKKLIKERIKENPDVVDLSDVDTREIRNMSSLFSNTKIKKLNLTNWNTSNVVNMANMFMNSTVEEIMGIEKFDTSKCDSFWKMFSGCESLYKIDLTDWDTSRCTLMKEMFCRCYLLSDVGDLSGWDTSNVINFTDMFYTCTHLEDIGDISGWKFTKAMFMSEMFRGCVELRDLHVDEIHTSWNVETVNVFMACSRMRLDGKIPQIIKDL